MVVASTAVVWRCTNKESVVIVRCLSLFPLFFCCLPLLLLPIMYNTRNVDFSCS